MAAALASGIVPLPEGCPSHPRSLEITPRSPEITRDHPEITPRSPEITPRSPEVICRTGCDSLVSRLHCQRRHFTPVAVSRCGSLGQYAMDVAATSEYGGSWAAEGALGQPSHDIVMTSEGAVT